jgi:hypothetical protein
MDKDHLPDKVLQAPARFKAECTLAEPTELDRPRAMEPAQATEAQLVEAAESVELAEPKAQVDNREAVAANSKVEAASSKAVPDTHLLTEAPTSTKRNLDLITETEEMSDCMFSINIYK